MWEYIDYTGESQMGTAPSHPPITTTPVVCALPQWWLVHWHEGGYSALGYA